MLCRDIYGDTGRRKSILSTFAFFASSTFPFFLFSFSAASTSLLIASLLSIAKLFKEIDLMIISFLAFPRWNGKVHVPFPDWLAYG